mmetsp:Transcript_23769/g.47301  ORF Transcript_23769/g.47301 Transcript_23769/m.47301 type:complete len:148 (+) Transcript_23769:173-616(+)|eukprot:CAMPEP_0182453506 /NCGR_PEP_ID=MMETSP1319-20130603/539_1 /TAXON_ID=172717 /ORGANISM="Bolidomonas pacifica, Strain RCC208" /LENGTH=147 /DNA_ID=CAMNT_0024651443 /DNA_START=154 /DNA_END=597 /DNA_ORIENTATION=+
MLSLFIFLLISLLSFPSCTPFTVHPLTSSFRPLPPLHLSSSPSSSSPPQPSDAPRPSRLQDPEILLCKEELISRYVSHGHPRSLAEAEVLKFLEDEDRSGPYLEMRRQAALQEVGRFTPEVGAALAAAFFLGLAGNVAPKVWEGLHM